MAQQRVGRPTEPRNMIAGDIGRKILMIVEEAHEGLESAYKDFMRRYPKAETSEQLVRARQDVMDLVALGDILVRFTAMGYTNLSDREEELIAYAAAMLDYSRHREEEEHIAFQTTDEIVDSFQQSIASGGYWPYPTGVNWWAKGEFPEFMKAKQVDE